MYWQPPGHTIPLCMERNGGGVPCCVSHLLCLSDNKYTVICSDISVRLPLCPSISAWIIKDNQSCHTCVVTMSRKRIMDVENRPTERFRFYNFSEWLNRLWCGGPFCQCRRAKDSTIMKSSHVWTARCWTNFSRWCFGVKPFFLHCTVLGGGGRPSQSQHTCCCHTKSSLRFVPANRWCRCVTESFRFAMASEARIAITTGANGTCGCCVCRRRCTLYNSYMQSPFDISQIQRLKEMSMCAVCVCMHCIWAPYSGVFNHPSNGVDRFYPSSTSIPLLVLSATLSLSLSLLGWACTKLSNHHFVRCPPPIYK